MKPILMIDLYSIALKRKLVRSLGKQNQIIVKDKLTYIKKEHRKMWKDVRQIDPEMKRGVQNLSDEETGAKIEEN